MGQQNIIGLGPFKAVIRHWLAISLS